MLLFLFLWWKSPILGEWVDLASTRAFGCRNSLRFLWHFGHLESLVNLWAFFWMKLVFGLQLILSLGVRGCNVEQVCLLLKQVLNILEALLLRSLLLFRAPVTVQWEFLQGLLAPELGLDFLIVHPVKSQGSSGVNDWAVVSVLDRGVQELIGQVLQPSLLGSEVRGIFRSSRVVGRLKIKPLHEELDISDVSDNAILKLRINLQNFEIIFQRMANYRLIFHDFLNNWFNIWKSWGMLQVDGFDTSDPLSIV